MPQASDEGAPIRRSARALHAHAQDSISHYAKAGSVVVLGDFNAHVNSDADRESKASESMHMERSARRVVRTESSLRTYFSSRASALQTAVVLPLLVPRARSSTRGKIRFLA